MELSRYLKVYEFTDSPETLLLYSTSRGAAVRVPRQLLADALNGNLPQEEQMVLSRLGMLVQDANAEKKEMETLFDRINHLKRPFSALVALNLDCNLACTYCYEKNFRNNSYMTIATADLLVNKIINEQIANGTDVILDFYGGEALLSLPILRHIATNVSRSATEAGLNFTFNLVTNGTLLSSEVTLELKKIGLHKVRFTLDGPPAIHDTQRPFASGKQTFNKILKNLQEVCELLSVQLGGNYTRGNYHLFPELLDILLERGITPEKLCMIMFSPVTSITGESGLGDLSVGCASPNEPWLIQASLFLRREILIRGFETPKPQIAACMVEFDSNLVIGWDGSIYKCPAFMGWDDMKIGSLTEGIRNYTDSHNKNVWKSEECLDCPYLPLCFGGCRFMRRLRTGSIDGVDCRKEYLDGALEKIIRQDLKLRSQRVATRRNDVGAGFFTHNLTV